jgi:LacI family transcriptional regulator
MNLEDIAKKAGVSRSTVSRVINNEPYVSEKTRERVKAIIAQEGFAPNPAARMLVTQRTRNIGFIIPQNPNSLFDDTSYYFPRLLQGASQEIDVQDYGMLLWLGNSGSDQERFYRRISQNRLMDGLIFASAANSSLLVSHLAQTEIPFITIEQPPEYADRSSYITVDNCAGARTAVQHLIQLGRRRIGHLTGPMDNVDGYDRLMGYKEALEAAGLPVDTNVIINGYFTRISGYEGMKALLAQETPIDAVFAASDSIALGALQALHEAGIRVPDDVAVIGFDDLPSAVSVSPQLTTIHQPVFDKGVLAARTLIQLIEGKLHGPQHIVLPTELVIRQSCGAVSGLPLDSGFRVGASVKSTKPT